jgi:hypothetical protein
MKKGSNKPAYTISAIFLILGVIAVYSAPINPLALYFGMLLVAIGIINLALIIPSPKPSYIELRVKEEKKPKKKGRKRKKRKK